MSYEPVTHTTTDRHGSPVSVSVHRYSGGDGPTVYVQAAQHGIELNGPATVRRLHERLVEADLAGSVVTVPVANPLAFDHRSYMTPPSYDVVRPDLNRIWPGDDDGTFLERVAARLWPLVENADAVVDLHTGTADMLEHVRVGTDDDARRLAEAFGTETLLVDRESALDLESGDSGKCRTAAASAGVPAITVELSNSRTVSPTAVEAGTVGVENVLRELDVLEAEPVDPPDQAVFYDDGEPLVATTAGLFERRAGLAVGDRLDADDELGAIYCPTSFERLQTVTTPEPGLLYSLSRGAVAVAGERLAAVARPD